MTVERLTNEAIHIKSHNAGLSIVLKTIAGSYTMVVRMPVTETDAATGLLVSGCRSDQILNIFSDENTSRETNLLHLKI